MLQEALSTIVAGKDLTRTEATAAMEYIMSGFATDAQIGALLVGLRMKGESIDEIAGFASAMRSHALLVNASRKPLLDTCGTGGSSFKVFNISTAAAFVAAAAGVSVAKHGNRAASGVCGSADVLEALGVRVEITPDQVAECIDTVGIGFLYARFHHPSMKHVSAARREIGVRTVFNLLGPLTNPAGASLQVMGVYNANLCPVAISVLRELGSERAMVIHSEPGIDELSTFSPNRICELKDGAITDTILQPEELGFTGTVPDRSRFAPAATPAGNAELLRCSLGDGPDSEVNEHLRGIVALNAAAALRVGGIVEDWPDAVKLARETIDRGEAIRVLDKLISLTASFAPLADLVLA
jgi:anthranilate phosphoribosyltransferase